MHRLVGFIAGAAAFWGAHAIERAHWADWFHGTYDPWFLNSGRAVVVTAGAVAAASALVAALGRSSRDVRGLTVTAGAFVAMTMVLFLKEGGAGTIFPIVIAVGAVLLLVASALGAWTGSTIGRLARARR